MERATLQDLLDAGAQRKAIAVITELASGGQRLVAAADRCGDPLEEALDRGFRFDRSGVHETPEGEVFIAIQNPPLQLVIIGAVHIAQCLAPMGEAAGYGVTVIDPRGAFATGARFPDANVRAVWPDEVLPDMQLDQRTAFVALTHDPKIDDPALTCALSADCFYIGALGSKRTQAARCERLSAAGVSDENLQRIHGPIGLDIGARAAPEIAIAIMAEITGALRQGR